MELFTLGEGHYGEHDIQEAARAFTGWSIEPASGAFRWRPFIHDRGVKTVLGESGNFDGDQVLDILLRQPATAEFIVTKLWREFISPQPDAAEVKRIAAAFRQSGYDIPTALRRLFLSPAFWSPENRWIGYFADGKLKKMPASGGPSEVIANVPDNRMASWPEAATVAESGLPGFSAYTWTALFAPAGTPPDIVQKINADANRILQAPKFREKLEAQGAIAGKGSTVDMGNFLKAEIGKWALLIKERNVKPD